MVVIGILKGKMEVNDNYIGLHVSEGDLEILITALNFQINFTRIKEEWCGCCEAYIVICLAMHPERNHTQGSQANAQTKAANQGIDSSGMSSVTKALLGDKRTLEEEANMYVISEEPKKSEDSVVASIQT